MSYSIDEGIEESIERLEAERCIKREFPDAVLRKLPNGDSVWTARDIEPTEVRLCVDEEGEIFICPYQIVRNMAVYGWGNYWASVVLKRFSETHFDGYRALVRISCGS